MASNIDTYYMLNCIDYGDKEAFIKAFRDAQKNEDNINILIGRFAGKDRL